MSETKVTVETNGAENTGKALDQKINTYMHGTLSIVFLSFMGAAMLMKITDFKTFVFAGMVVGGWVPLHYVMQIVSAVYGSRLPGGTPKGPTMPPPVSAVLAMVAAKLAGVSMGAGAAKVASSSLAAVLATSVLVTSCSGYLDAHRTDPVGAIQNIDVPLIRAAVTAARTFASIAGLSPTEQGQMDEVLGHIERGAALVSSGASVAGSPSATNTFGALRDLKALLEGFGVRIGQRANPRVIEARSEALSRVRAALGE